jgi:hypothetical protein
MEKRTNGMAIGKKFPFPRGYGRVRRFPSLRGMRKHACVRDARQRIPVPATGYSSGIDIETNSAGSPVRFGSAWLDLSSMKREEIVINEKRSRQCRTNV